MPENNKNQPAGENQTAQSRKEPSRRPRTARKPGNTAPKKPAEQVSEVSQEAQGGPKPQGGRPASNPAAASGEQKAPTQRRRRSPKKPAAEMPAKQQGQNQPAQPAAPQQAEPGQEAKGRGRRQGGQNTRNRKPPLKIISLGGLGEIGKNMTVIEYQNDMFIVDCGLAFPDDDMPGIDLVIPDFTYVIKNQDRLRGIVLTHGHEDHIGSLSYLLKEVDVPVYSTRLTLGLVEGKLKEQGVLGKAKLIVVRAGDTVRMGCMSVEFINVNHSIPDACGFAIFTPVGTIVHTGDFKIDYTPIDGDIINLARFGELGTKGVLALMSDSTNAERPGITPSERRVGDSLDMLFRRSEDKRIILATFSSNVHRIQQIINSADTYGRKVVVSGRSMENVVAKATELGYLKVPKGILVEVEKMRNFPDREICLITTGSQGEPMSALTRMAFGEHRKVSITPNDCVIISATPIPGNEKLVGRVINELMKLGADVVYENTLGIHVSGHASREDIRTIIGLTKPKFFIPVHGEYKHLVKCADLAIEMGIPKDHIAVSEIGRVIELTQKDVRITSTVPSGAIMVDGSGVGDVGSIVLRDRKLLAEDGLIVVVATIDKTGKVVAGPDVVSRGFVYVRESEELLSEARQRCKQAIEGASGEKGREWANLKQLVKDQLGSYLFSQTKRRPMILPIIQEVK